MRQSTTIIQSLGFCQYNFIDSRNIIKNQFSIHKHQRQSRHTSLQITSSSVLSAIANSDDEKDINDTKDDIQLPPTQQQDPSMFFELMSPIDTVKPEQMSASSLAYLGDVVFELFVRSRYVWPSRRMSDLQNKVVSVVRGKIHIVHIICDMHMLYVADTFTLCNTFDSYRMGISYIAEAQSILLQK